MSQKKSGFKPFFNNSTFFKALTASSNMLIVLQR